MNVLFRLFLPLATVRNAAVNVGVQFFSFQDFQFFSLARNVIAAPDGNSIFNLSQNYHAVFLLQYLWIG